MQKLLKKIEKYDDFLDLRSDPEIAGALWSKYSTVIKLWEDSQQIKLRRRSTMEEGVAYLEERGFGTLSQEDPCLSFLACSKSIKEKRKEKKLINSNSRSSKWEFSSLC